MRFDNEKEKKDLINLLNAATFKEVSVNDSFIIAETMAKLAQAPVGEVKKPQKAKK